MIYEKKLDVDYNLYEYMLVVSIKWNFWSKNDFFMNTLHILEQ